MTRIRFVRWKEEDFHLGYFEDYPDYLTQGVSYEELVENLKDLYKDLASGSIPFLKKVEELVVVE